MMGRFVYVIGEPGSGKSTALRNALEHRWPGVTHYETTVARVPTLVFEHDGAPVCCEAGRRRNAFSGTDALSLSIMPHAVRWVSTPLPAALRVAEGDRLASDKFFSEVAMHHDLTVVWLDAPPPVLVARRTARGSKQDATWLKGRATKVHRLAREWGATRIDCTHPPARVAAELAALL